MALTSQQVQELRRRILERRRALAAELRGDAERARGETFGALTGETHDAAEESVADLFADLDQAEMSRDLAELRDLEAARLRLSAGTYGVCADCGGEIGYERLRANPAALRCIACQTRHEKTFAGPGAPKL
ncbi:MAG TPA: TraR/DksA family transcriptional regulator [Burkholderiales bacterium]|jgi:RNA polymerase-binding transcription factor DksA|nr:TraR/DksA family transcriptional regulator [Burkholderiales bacterium]